MQPDEGAPLTTVGSDPALGEAGAAALGEKASLTAGVVDVCSDVKPPASGGSPPRSQPANAIDAPTATAMNLRIAEPGHAARKG
jgi:hypothetical protein